VCAARGGAVREDAGRAKRPAAPAEEVPKRSLFVRRGKEGFGFGRGIGTPSRKPLLNISQQQNPVHGNIDKTAPFLPV
jgi:hypothetical protein